MDTELKTVVIYETTKARLDKLKPHPRATYDEVISNLLDSYETWGGEQ